MLVVNGEDCGSQLRPGAGEGGKGPTCSSFFPAFKIPGRFQVEDQPSFRRIIQTILIEFILDLGGKDTLGLPLHPLKLENCNLEKSKVTSSVSLPESQ